MGMRIEKGAIIMLLLTAMMLLITGQALAQHGSATSGSGSFFDPLVNPNARGTKVAGTLSLYHYPTCNPLQTDTCETQYCLDGKSQEQLTDFVYTFRVIPANSAPGSTGDYIPFSGLTHNVCFAADIGPTPGKTTQVSIITDFIGNVVLPGLFGPGSYPWQSKWDFKSVSSVVDPSDAKDPCCNGMEFMILDFTLAVH
jgi:hypothetical protein